MYDISAGFLPTNSRSIGPIYYNNAYCKCIYETAYLYTNISYAVYESEITVRSTLLFLGCGNLYPDPPDGIVSRVNYFVRRIFESIKNRLPATARTVALTVLYGSRWYNNNNNWSAKLRRVSSAERATTVSAAEHRGDTSLCPARTYCTSYMYNISHVYLLTYLSLHKNIKI